MPDAPQSVLMLKSNDDVPMLRVRPDAKTLPVARVEIYYSIDPDPRARFWRSAEVKQEHEGYLAQLPIHTHDLPLFAFANVYYTLPNPESLAQMPGYGKPVQPDSVHQQKLILTFLFIWRRHSSSCRISDSLT